MGAFIALFVIGLFLYGGYRIAYGVRSGLGKAVGLLASDTPATPVRRTPSEQHPVAVIVKAMELEGYYGRVRLADDQIQYVDHPVIAGMFTDLAKDHELAWLLPQYDLRLRTVPDEAPVAFRKRYTWVVMSPTHAIGITLP